MPSAAPINPSGNLPAGIPAFVTNRKGWLVLLALTIVAVILRLALLPAGNLQRAFDPSGDSDAYVELAQGLRHGCGFARLHDGKCASGAEIDRTPSYPLYLALCANLRAALTVQVMLAGVIIFAVGAFTYLSWGLAPAIAASALVALDIPSIVYAVELMTETLFTACFALATLIALCALRSPRRSLYSVILLLLVASVLLAFGC